MFVFISASIFFDHSLLSNILLYLFPSSQYFIFSSSLMPNSTILYPLSPTQFSIIHFLMINSSFFLSSFSVFPGGRVLLNLPPCAFAAWEQDKSDASKRAQGGIDSFVDGDREKKRRSPGLSVVDREQGKKDQLKWVVTKRNPCKKTKIVRINGRLLKME